MKNPEAKENLKSHVDQILKRIGQDKERVEQYHNILRLNLSNNVPSNQIQNNNA